jgi:hypothetical protein
MDGLQSCLTALRIAASSDPRHRHVIVERLIDEFLRADPFSLSNALERLRKAIYAEDEVRHQGEDWGVAKDYVRSLQDAMAD